MKKEELYIKIKDICEILTVNNASWDKDLFQKGFMIVTQSVSYTHLTLPTILRV